MGKLEDKAREIAKVLYGDNYDHSQYEKMSPEL